MFLDQFLLRYHANTHTHTRGHACAHTHTHTHGYTHTDSDEYSIVAFCKNATTKRLFNSVGLTDKIDLHIHTDTIFTMMKW